MKYALLIFLTYLTFSHQMTPAKIFEGLISRKKMCQQETSTDPAFVNKLLNYGDFIDHPNLKCFVKCILIKYVDEDGKFQAEEIERGVTAIDSAKIAGALTKCKDTKGSDPCETAFKSAKCVYENIN